MRVELHADDPALRTDERREGRGLAARAGAQVEHPIPGSGAGGAHDVHRRLVLRDGPPLANGGEPARIGTRDPHRLGGTPSGRWSRPAAASSSRTAARSPSTLQGHPRRLVVGVEDRAGALGPEPPEQVRDDPVRVPRGEGEVPDRVDLGLRPGQVVAAPGQAPEHAVDEAAGAVRTPPRDLLATERDRGVDGRPGRHVGTEQLEGAQPQDAAEGRFHLAQRARQHRPERPVQRPLPTQRVVGQVGGEGPVTFVLEAGHGDRYGEVGPRPLLLDRPDGGEGGPPGRQALLEHPTLPLAAPGPGCGRRPGTPLSRSHQSVPSCSPTSGR
jgi:hypothetical protein